MNRRFIFSFFFLIIAALVGGVLWWFWSSARVWWSGLALGMSLLRSSESGGWSIFLWVFLLLGFTVVLGIVAIMGGMGGGMLYVSIVSSFFPFHLDFVRGASLMMALCGALSACPGLLRFCLTDLRLALPAGLMSSLGSVLGAMIGLALPAQLVQTALGLVIMLIAAIMIKAKRTELPVVEKPDAISQLLRIQGSYCDLAVNQRIFWVVHRTPLALGIFFLVGIMAGTFGIGGGAANVAVLNLLMGVPLKVAVATSTFLISMTDSAAVWVYLHSGAVLPIIAVPSIIGMVLGSWLGVKILVRARPANIRFLVIVLLIFAGIRNILKGLNIWG
ncbi:MAG: sulfite exporter TauE/SafE family protein [Deltaproteobacteria bacterium]|nr:sulfite exporter TauE/SafE family protein [Deltaproteobacteria bacterium]